jgi:Zn-dependent M28 family amino/carboxypeptidase
MAEVLAKTPIKDRPDRSFLFLFPTAEEQGLLGSEYYSGHPLVPLAKTAANVNVDGVNFFGKLSDFMPLGADRSSIMDSVTAAAKERNLKVEFSFCKSWRAFGVDPARRPVQPSFEGRSGGVRQEL